MPALIAPNFRDILEPNIQVGRFPDGDSHLRIPGLANLAGQKINLFYRLYPKQNSSIVELFFLLETLRENNCEVTLIVPHLPYARQDKVKLDGEVASGVVLCNLLARAGCRKLVTFDCHFLNEEGEVRWGELLIENICMGPELTKYAKDFFGDEEFEIVSPDAGAAYLAAAHGGKVMRKVREEYAREGIAYRNIESMDADFSVEGKNVLILDDMISTGSTMIKAAEKMKQGGAGQICCAATHGLFLYNCMDKLQKIADSVFATDTIPTDLSRVSIKDELASYV